MAVAITTAMAIVGRLTLGTMANWLDQRIASALSLASQAAALGVMMQTRDETILLAACAVYGFSVGNLITFPALIVQREFEAAAFGMIISLSTGISQFTYAFGPGLFGPRPRRHRRLSGSARRVHRAQPHRRRPRPQAAARAGNPRLANIPGRMPACAQLRQRKLDPRAGSPDCPAPMQDTAQTIGKSRSQIESTYAWVRLWVSVLLGTIGSVGMWAGVVTLPAVQAEFGVSRADASLPYTLTMIGFGLGAVGIGRLVDRFGVVPPLMTAVLLLGIAFVASGVAPSIFVYALASMAIGARQLRHLRPAHRRHLALVRAPPRHRRCHLRLGQLHRRRHLASRSCSI